MAARLDTSLLPLLEQCLSLGMLTLDRDGYVLSQNDAATMLLAEGDGLGLDRGRLVARRREDALALEGLLAGAGRPARGRESGGGGIMEVARRVPGRAVTVIAVPLRWPLLDDQTARPAVLVLISDLGGEASPLETMLARRYGLTQAETTVALLVLDGAGVEDLARCRNTSINTARTHLKRVREKLGVRSQAELVRVLLTRPTPAAVARLPRGGALPWLAEHNPVLVHGAARRLAR